MAAVDNVGLLAGALMALHLGACARDLGLEELRFACARDEECARGTRCDLSVHLCRSGGGEADGGLDASVADADADPRDAEVPDRGPPADSGAPAMSAVATAGDHSCALSVAGEVYCWGSNVRGQLGRGTIGADERVPARVQGLSGVREIGAGLYHTCALTTGGDMYCWGSSRIGECGEDGGDVSAPRSTPVLRGVRSLAVGRLQATCALLEDGRLMCMGFILDGQGWQYVDGGAHTAQPYEVRGFSGELDSAVAGFQFGCAVVGGGERVECFGQNGVGQLGDGTLQSRPLPAPLSLGPGISGAASGSAHACAVVQGVVWCWGEALMLGGEASAPPLPPTEMAVGGPVEQVYAGYRASCARLLDRTVRCWGLSTHGQAGGPVSSRFHDPDVVLGLGTVQAMDAHHHHSCAVNDSGELLCWGLNAHLQLGRSTHDVDNPVAEPVEWR